MSVIIRLQNLPWSANAMDIRNFFHGLSIPEGGVHIVGGELGDAFIAFSTDEDARQAMLNNGGKIKEIQVHLLLSSRSEMHKVIEAARQTVPFMQLPQPVAPQPPILSQSLTSMLTQNMKPTPIIPIQPAIVPSGGSPAMNDLSPFAPNPSADVVIINDDKDTKRKDRRSVRSRPRDRQRDRRDRRNRSRSRDHSDDRRRRSRSRERRRRSRERERSRERSDRGSRERSRERSDRGSRERVSRERSSRDSESRRGRDRNQDDKLKESRWGGGPQQQQPFGGNNGTANNVTTGPNRAINPWDPPPIAEPINPYLNRITNPGDFRENMIQNQFGSPIPTNQLSPFDSNRKPQMLNAIAPLMNKPAETSVCVQMINVPVHVAYVDILRFFAGLEIANTGIKFINDHMGRRSGVVYIKFKRAEDKATALKKNGGFLKGVNVLVTNISEQEFDRAIDGLHFSKRDDRAMNRAIERTIDLDDDSLVICDSSDKMEPAKERVFSVLFLEELPHFVKEHDVVKMFTDYPLLSIKFRPMNDMRKQLSSYVQFAKAEDAKQALSKRHLHVLGHKIIKVTACYPDDYEKIKDKLNDDMDDEDMMMDKDEEEPVLEEEVEEVAEVRDPRQKRLEATNKVENVPFQNPLFNFPMMGNAPTQQFPWRPPLLNMDMGMNMGMGMPFQNQQIPGPRNINFDRNNQRPDGGPVLDCVLLEGLPLRTTDRDILDFFSDVGIVPARIHIMLDGQGSPSGRCFCEFNAREEAGKAASKHGSMFGMNEVSIEPVPRAVVREALGMPSMEGPAERPGRGPALNARLDPRTAGGDFAGRGEEAPAERGGFAGRGGFRGRGGPRGGGYPPRGRGFGARGPFRGRGGFDGRGPPPPEDGPDNFGRPGCVLSLDNVPFRCGTEDVLRFFGEFDLSNDAIIRRFNERGQPTGEARVGFHSPQEAKMAMQKLNMKMLHGRTVSIRLL